MIYSDPDPWRSHIAYPTIGNGKIFITNNGSDSITWVDLDTLQPVFEEPVGRIPAEREGPHHGAAAATSYFVGLSNFVPGSGSGPHGSHGTGTVPGFLLKYDLATHALSGVLLVDRSPGDVRLTPDGRLALVSHFDLRRIQEVTARGGAIADMTSSLYIVDQSAMSTTDVSAGELAVVPVCPAPHGIAPSADSTRAYVACWGSDALAVVSLAPPYAVETFPIVAGEIPDPTNPRHAPYAIAISPADGSVWVSNQVASGGNQGDVRVFDPAARQWDATRGVIRTGGVPFFGDFTADGATFIVPNQIANTLSVIDTATGAIRQTLALPPASCLAPHAVLITPDQQRALVVCEGDHVGRGSVAVVAVGGGAAAVFERSFLVGVYPDDAFLVKP